MPPPRDPLGLGSGPLGSIPLVSRHMRGSISLGSISLALSEPCASRPLASLPPQPAVKFPKVLPCIGPPAFCVLGGGGGGGTMIIMTRPVVDGCALVKWPKVAS